MDSGLLSSGQKCKFTPARTMLPLKRVEAVIGFENKGLPAPPAGAIHHAASGAGTVSATVQNQSRLVGGYRRSNSRRCSGSSKSRGLSGGSGTSPVVNTADQAPFRRNPRLTLRTAIAMTKMNTMSA
jgi:hypothetical protein